MRKVLLVAAPLVLALIVGLQLQSAFERRAQVTAFQTDRLRLQREFDERAAVLRAAPTDGPVWRDEVNALLRGYLEQLAEARNAYPEGARAAEEARKERASGKVSPLAEEFQKYADARMKLLGGGAYAPVASAVAGGMRLDVVAVEAGTGPTGPGLRIDFALWGPPRILERTRTNDGTVSRTVVPVVFKNVQFRILDAAGKDYAEMSGGGEPDLRLDNPESFVPDFPPGVLFATRWVDLLPREAATVELRQDVDARAPSGGNLPASFAITLPVQDQWRIPVGAKYEAQVREVTPAPTPTPTAGK